VAVDGDTAYVLGELASTVTVCEVTGVVLTPGESVSLRRPDAEGENTAAEVVLVEGEVLGSNRGDDTVAVLTRWGAGLRMDGSVPCGGSWPRWMGVVDAGVLVANERSGGVALLRRSPEGWAVADVLDWPTPTCCAALPG
jgi:6-phosphogluconolactonase (cycloisomerase 2 family)